jgi:hypothetical protein
MNSASIKYLVLALSLFVGTSAMAQEDQAAPKSRKPTKEHSARPEGGEPGRTMKPSRGAGKLAASYADSTEFNKAFDDLYMIIKPTVTVQERADKIFMSQTRSFTRTGVDSAKAYEAVMKAIDPTLDRQLIYSAYRAQLTAEELRGWIAFLKTPAGKKILEVGDKLLAADDRLIESQVRRAVNTAIAPLRQPKTPKTQELAPTSAPINANGEGGQGSGIDPDLVKEKK